MKTTPDCPCPSRRTFLCTSLGCGAYVTLALAGASALARRAFAARPVGETILEKPFSRVEKIGDGVWASVATPRVANDYTTVSNGGIIAGNDSVLLIEGHNTIAGGAWAAKTAERLTGRWPTHVIVTHLHGDHVNGLPGCHHPDHTTDFIATETTRRMMGERALKSTGEFDPESQRATLGAQILLPNVLINDTTSKTKLDLGGRTVIVKLHKGHTPSDITIELEDPHVVFCGDLVFNHIFPYFGDAIPTVLTQTCRELCTDPDTLYVPGHGSLATNEDLAPYVEMLSHLGEAARSAFKRGRPPEVAAREYKVPGRLGEWYLWSDNVIQLGFEAWYRELRGE